MSFLCENISVLSVTFKVSSRWVQRREVGGRCIQGVEWQDDRWPSSDGGLLWCKEQPPRHQEAIRCQPVGPLHPVCVAVSARPDVRGVAGSFPDSVVCRSAEEARRTTAWVRARAKTSLTGVGVPTPPGKSRNSFRKISRMGKVCEFAGMRMRKYSRPHTSSSRDSFLQW